MIARCWRNPDFMRPGSASIIHVCQLQFLYALSLLEDRHREEMERYWPSERRSSGWYASPLKLLPAESAEENCSIN